MGKEKEELGDAVAQRWGRKLRYCVGEERAGLLRSDVGVISQSDLVFDQTVDDDPAIQVLQQGGWGWNEACLGGRLGEGGEEEQGFRMGEREGVGAEGAKDARGFAYACNRYARLCRWCTHLLR